MKLFKYFIYGAFLVLFLSSNSTGPAKNSIADLKGSWTLIKYKYGEEQELSEVPRVVTYVKHLTSTHFAWASYGEQGNLVAAGGGTYEATDNEYQEHIIYFHPLGSNLPGSSVKFEYTMNGNNWTISGYVRNVQLNPGSGKYELVDSIRLEEVWRRL